MRVWSGLFFIPEMLAFQRVPLDAPLSLELTARVARWTFWTWFREPLDALSFLFFLLALFGSRDLRVRLGRRLQLERIEAVSMPLYLHTEKSGNFETLDCIPLERYIQNDAALPQA
jgi:hypothetical protein